MVSNPPSQEIKTPVGDAQQQHRIKRNRKIILISAAVIFVLAGASGLTAYFLTRRHEATTEPPVPTSTKLLETKASFTSLTTIMTTTSSTTTTTTATPLPPVVPKGQLIGYYGQNAIANGVDIVKGTNGRITTPAEYQKSLTEYCSLGLYNTINLGFLNAFGGGNKTFTITFAGFSVSNYGGVYTYRGKQQETNPPQVVQGYIKIGQDIKSCQASGVKVILSLGGDKVSPYSFIPGDGLAYAQLFYDMFLEGTSPIRPFGPDVILDGIELDIEKNDRPPIWTPEMISLITRLRALSPSTILAIVPQCFLNGGSNKDLNVGDVIASTTKQINYIIVQYYNNPVCSYPFGFNFATWKSLYPGLPIVVGLAGDWTSAISGGFLPTGQLQAVHDMISGDPQFLGYSVYDVSSSNPPARAWDNSTATLGASPPLSSYSQTLRNVLDGQIVGSGFGPQGEAVSETQMAMRCGGTWVSANNTCTNRACTSSNECNKCAVILRQFVLDGNGGAFNAVIPGDVISKARGIAIIQVVRAGLHYSGRFGTGVVIAKLPDGTWSAPSVVKMGGVGVGFVIGVETTDLVLVLNTDAALASFLQGENVTLSGNLSVAAGPIGRSAEAGAALVGTPTPIFSYSQSRGLLVGASFEGSAIMEGRDANASFYGRTISAKEILAGVMPKPAAAAGLYKTLELRAAQEIAQGAAPVYPTPPSYATSAANEKTQGNLFSSFHTPIPQPAEPTSTPPLPYRDDLMAQAPPNPPAYSNVVEAIHESVPAVAVERLTTTSSSSSSSSSRPLPVPPTATGDPSSNLFLALHDYNSDEAGDLSFKSGDCIRVTQRNADGWWYGSLEKKEGAFPSTFVRPL
ncbi:hypothetical protein HDU79_002442 [Rhizoclosmatium sp. JEL0117]|nr:hypothetical protein HDU79_002442 [Rhizoclosmatium sp. JEL0117]